jgi:adenosine deaminase
MLYLYIVPKNTGVIMIELHCHLDGSIRESTLLELYGDSLPDIYFYPGMGLDKALSSFSTTLSVMQSLENLERISFELCEDLKADGVTKGEIRFAPQLHGKDWSSIIDAVSNSMPENFNLILCGLYGEDPDVLSKLVDLAKNKNKVVGIDLAGAPSDDHKWSLFDYSYPFKKAKYNNLGRTVHAGEGRSAKEIEVAINFLYAQRIGHGLSALDDWKTKDLILEKDILIEACLTSNYQTGCIKSIYLHPMKKWLKEGIKFSLCADNTLLSKTSLKKEISIAVDHCGLTDEDIELTQMWAEEKMFLK